MRLFTASAVWMLLALAWTGVIFVFSSQPHSEQDIAPYLQRHVSESALKEMLPDVTIEYNHQEISSSASPFLWLDFLFRKSAHLSVYAVLALLWAQWLRGKLSGPLLWLAVLSVVAFTASADEMNQATVPGRFSNAGDVAIDAAGGLIGLSLLTAFYKIQNVLTRYRL